MEHIRLQLLDLMRAVKQLMEKAQHYKIERELLFIDFQHAFDSINRNELRRVLKELGVGAKLGRLIVMTMEGTTASVLRQKGETEEFEFNRGVRQGDAQSATLFNLA